MLAAAMAVSAFAWAIQVTPSNFARRSRVVPAMSIDVSIEAGDMLVVYGLAYWALCVSMCGNDMEKADTCMHVWLRNKKDTAKKEEALALHGRWEKHPVDQLILVAQWFGNPTVVRVLLILVAILASAMAVPVGIDGTSMGLSAEVVRTVQKFAGIVGMKGGMTVLTIAGLCVAQCGNDMEKVDTLTAAADHKFNKGTRKGNKWKKKADRLNSKWENTPFNKLYRVPELPEVPQVLKPAFATLSLWLKMSQKTATNDPKKRSIDGSPPGNKRQKRKNTYNYKKQKK